MKYNLLLTLTQSVGEAHCLGLTVVFEEEKIKQLETFLNTHNTGNLSFVPSEELNLQREQHLVRVISRRIK